jgi:hypothetical protein
MLTAEGLKYSESFLSSYKREAEIIEDQLKLDKHGIPYDVVSIFIERYMR